MIGREYPTVNIVDDLLNAENSDELLRDLAITGELDMRIDGFGPDLYADMEQVSQRGVVFFRKQDNLTDDLQKLLNHKLGALTGKPSSSSLHIHPVHNGMLNRGRSCDYPG